MPQTIRALLLLSLLSFLFCAPAAHAADDSVPLIADGKPICVIVRNPQITEDTRTATRLADYLATHAGAKPTVIAPADLNRAQGTLILIDSAPHHPLLAAVDLKLDVPADRPDAYAIKVFRQRDRTLIALAGPTPTGAKYAAYRLMEEMAIEPGRSATVPPLDLRASPFFATRVVSLFNIWRVPVDVIRQCNLESWPADKIRANVDTYDAFGFNALETHDRFHEDFLRAVYGLSRTQWRDKVYALADRAHENGMSVFLRLWGNSVALPVKEVQGNTPFGFVNLAPDLPQEKKRWGTEIRDYASKTYASHIDHLIGHWADAGGIHPGSNATVKDSMLLHNELVAAFRAINPNLQSTFNLWGMANPKGIRGWPGYEDHNSIARAGILPSDVAIAQTTRSHSHRYAEKVTADIRAAGHPAAVWTWRRADTEVRFGDAGIRIRLHDLVGDYFRSLPDSARELQWHNIERNHHGLANDVNYYVAGKLMWDPKADVDALLLKYCALVFGQSNAQPIAEAFNTIEASRHIEQFVSNEVVAHPAAARKRATAALQALRAIHLSDSHRSRLPSVTSPQEMLTQLRDSLAVIADNAAIIADKLPALDSLIQSGKTDEARALAANLKSKADTWSGTIAGGVEAAWLRKALTERLPSESAPATASTQPDSVQFGFHTHNLASLDKSDPEGHFSLTSRGDDLAFALAQLPQPAAGPIEFSLTLQSLEPEGNMRNGGLAFGPTTAPDQLLRVDLYLRGKLLHLRGRGVKPVRHQLPNLDPAAQHRLTICIDPASRTLTATVDDNPPVQTSLTGNLAPIRYYGYSLEHTSTRFGPIAVKPADK